MPMSLFSGNSILKPKTCRITLSTVLKVLMNALALLCTGPVWQLRTYQFIDTQGDFDCYLLRQRNGGLISGLK